LTAPCEVRTAADWSLRSEDNIRIIAQQPHKLGWLIGLDKLNPIHSDWIKYIWENNGHRALQAYRGGYKTTAVVMVGTIRWMLFHPDDRILLTRKSFKVAAEVIKAISQAMQLREIQELFKQAHGRYPQARINREGNLTYSFKQTITPEGNVTGMGIDQGITGHHFDRIINDDIITLRDRISRAERERTIEMVREIATNIIDPEKGCGWTGTPWHREDGWRIIKSFAPIARYPISGTSYCSTAKKQMKNNFIGEEAIEKKRRTTTPYLYSANYELELGKDESLLFSDPLWPRRWDYSIHSAMCQLDTAFDGDHYCALTIAAPIRKEGGNQWYQAVGFTYPGNVEDWESTISRLCKKYRVKYVYVETNADKGASAKRLAARGLRVKPYAEGMNKHAKIGTYLYAVWPYVEWAAETDEEYMSQVIEYKEGITPDDAPDSAASLFKEAFSKEGAARLARWEM
jgi:hypothetical protein